MPLGARGRLCTCILILLALLLYQRRCGPDVGSTTPRSPSLTIANLSITLKTGATESLDRLPTTLNTALRYVPRSTLLIVSDHPDNSPDTGHHIHDILSASYSRHPDYPDFRLYKTQHALWGQGLNAQAIATHLQAHDAIATRNQAWILDRWKFLPMLYHTYQHHFTLNPSQSPSSDSPPSIYLFLETDTYPLLPALLPHLSLLSTHPSNRPTSRPLYAGLHIPGIPKRPTPFIHGGPGVILNTAALALFAADYETNIARWEASFVAPNCCGDYALGLVMAELGIEVTDLGRGLSVEPPELVAFGRWEVGGRWMEEVLGLHHLDVEGMRAITGWEAGWRSEHRARDVLRWKDVWVGFVAPRLWEDERATGEEGLRRVDWDNRAVGLDAGMSGGVVLDLTDGKGRESVEACETLCRARWQCLSYLFREGRECMLFPTFALGRKAEPYKGLSWVSGWMQQRIQELVEDVEAWSLPDGEIEASILHDMEIEVLEEDLRAELSE